MRELALTRREIILATGISRRTLNSYLAGENRSLYRMDKLRDLSLALGWTPDSLKRVLVGEDPVDAHQPVDTDPSSSPEALLRFLLDELVRLRTEQNDLSRRIEDLRRELTENSRDGTPRTA
jgi:transcriptional regulator with XRE-family HTH domain